MTDDLRPTELSPPRAPHCPEMNAWVEETACPACGAPLLRYRPGTGLPVRRCPCQEATP